jgi:hypothetical protein
MAVTIFGVILGGVGHGWGIAVVFFLSIPSSLLGGFFPKNAVMIWIVGFGFVQWLIIGLCLDRLSARKRKN